MSLKPVLVVIPQRTLRFLSGLDSTCNGCPPVLVARRQASSEQQCNTEQDQCAAGREIIPVNIGEESSRAPHQPEPSRSIVEDEGGGEGEEEGPDRRGTGGSGDEAVESEDAVSVAPSRAVKHKAVEQRRKKKISDAVQQLLEALQPPSPAGKMTRAEILERAVDKIKTLKEENKQLKTKIDNLPQPGKETELYNKLSKQVTEYLALKSQLEYMEKQRSESNDQETESHDLGAESCDLVQDQDQTIASREPLPAATYTNPTPSSTVLTMTSSSNSTTTANENSPNTTSCSVARIHINDASVSSSSQSNGISTANTGQTGETTYSRIGNIRAAEAPPPVSTHQPWPVTSILSQDNSNHCPHATATNTSYHGNRNLTTSGGQNTTLVSMHRDTSAHVHNICPVSSASAPLTNSLFHQPDRTLALPRNSSVCLSSSSLSSNEHQRNVITDHQLQPSRNNAIIHSRTGSGLASLHGNYQCHHNGEPLQVIRHCERSTRERQREPGYGGYSPANQTSERYHSSTTHGQIQPHTLAIVQPWVESSHRPRPLHHVTNTTPTPRIFPQYNTQHHQEQHRQNTHTHTERFLPYPYPRVNHHNSPSTFSPASWSHDNHMTTPSTSSREIAPHGRSYATSPYDLHQQHFSTQLSGRSGYNSNYDYSRNYSTTQGHPSSTQGAGHPSWMPYFTPSQQNSSRSSSMMSHDTQATPPYPIQPHPHGSGSSGTSPAVWRPYSERTRSSGFCLADILSLPSETEATPLSMEVTPPTGHHSFLVNRLLDDI